MFQLHPLTHGLIADRSTDPWPTVVRSWDEAKVCLDEGTHFGFVWQGPATLRCAAGTFELRSLLYFSVPGSMTIHGGAGLLVTHPQHHGLLHIGGPIEERGRLRYIDGCTDSLLIPPVVRGDPCLNLLHVPAHTHQTSHTHPSLRVGLIVAGQGECRTREEDYPLRAGSVFLIEANGLHSFHTTASELRIIAYHPDSDFGPTHEDHPMLNRTIVAS